MTNKNDETDTVFILLFYYFIIENDNQIQYMRQIQKIMH